MLCFVFGEAVLDLGLVSVVLSSASVEDWELAVFLELDAAIHDFLLSPRERLEALDSVSDSTSSSHSRASSMESPEVLTGTLRGDLDGLLLAEPEEEPKLLE